MSPAPWSRLGPVTLLMVLTIALLGSPLGMTSASANLVCQLNGDHHWGYRHSPAGIRASGAQANIETTQANLCTSSLNTKSKAVAALYAGSQAGFAQVGWRHDQINEYRYNVFEYSKNGSVTTVVYLYSITGSNTNMKYKATWQNDGDGTIHFIICNPDGSGCTDYGHTPFQGSEWADIAGRVEGFTDDSGTDLPGTTSEDTDFSQIQWREGGGAWGVYGHVVLSDNVTRYHISDLGDQKFLTWTYPL